MIKDIKLHLPHVMRISKKLKHAVGTEIPGSYMYRHLSKTYLKIGTVNSVDDALGFLLRNKIKTWYRVE